MPTGFEHGTVTIVVDGVPHEVTTLREDIETDGRRAKVLFGRSFENDAFRRDFTMNALSITADGRVFDYANGLEDIAARRVRFIGEARQRIREDYLRSLRFFRFHAAYGVGAMDQDAFNAIITERAGLETLSRERIGAELLKLLVAPRAAEVAADISDAGLLLPLLGGILLPARLARVAAIEAARGEAPDAVLRLGALCVLSSHDCGRLRDTIRASKAMISRMEHACIALFQPLYHAAPAPRELRALLFEQGRTTARDAITLAHAQSRAAPDDAAWLSAWRFARDTPEPRSPFSGADLMARGLPGGRQMGATLKRLQASWIRAGFPTDPTELARLIDEAMPATK